MPLMNVNAKTRDNNAMHAKADLRVILEWTIAGSGSVIADVIRSGIRMPISTETIVSVALADMSMGTVFSRSIAYWHHGDGTPVVIDGDALTITRYPTAACFMFMEISPRT